ncbi:hypothetical protein AGRA3207_003422 [Actinomadura graeca]|uniref:Uncharacterized protein n=1 Tax=Actinomadura graeca TaxID=2750812 RepID=A0ABX8QUK3_9ACTN|nr:hypothetical protein [Actinomadura graeca]QXJ22426.1 hypothetical protein AGRA3207_003422 [Actinomadura graeca]
MPSWAPGHVLRLTADGDGRAIGRALGSCGYMMMRGQRPPIARWPDDPAGAADETGATRLDPRAVVWDAYGADLALAALLPGVRYEPVPRHAEEFVLRITDDAGSWACVLYVAGDVDYTVHQAGARSLWDEVYDAYMRWMSWGRPGRERFGITVDSGGLRVWLDSPSGGVG